MAIDELEVYVTPNGFGRAAIVRRSDGLLCIYVHWKLSLDAIATGRFQVPQGYKTSWMDDETPSSKLYEDHDPEKLAKAHPKVKISAVMSHGQAPGFVLKASDEDARTIADEDDVAEVNADVVVKNVTAYER